jgi:hypothetical protein
LRLYDEPGIDKRKAEHRARCHGCKELELHREIIQRGSPRRRELAVESGMPRA